MFVGIYYGCVGMSGIFILIILFYLGSVASVLICRASHLCQPGEKDDTKKKCPSRPLLRGTPHWTGREVSSATLWPASSTN